MKTIEYNEFTIKANFHNKGNYILLRIEKVWEAKDKANPNFVETIIEFGQTFSTEEEVEKFKSSSFFNVIYCAVLKEINKELDKIIDSGIPFEKSIKLLICLNLTYSHQSPFQLAQLLQC